MNRVIYNIGYSSISSGILTWYPQCIDGTFADFVKLVRNEESIETLFGWAKENHVPPSSLILMIRIDEENQYWEYTVKLINVREYRKYWELKYNKEWKEN